MKLAQIPNCHLTYCTNIHPGESWQQVFSQFRKYLPVVKHSISPNQDFGIGARLSSVAVLELLQGDNLAEFKTWLSESGLYVFTINGFPYGQFHQQKIKENVYLPDWSDPARVEYSKQLAIVLAELLPEGCIGTISTVPVGLKSNFDQKEKLIDARDNLLSMAAFLLQLHQETGQQLQLALEPEPGCYLETSDDVVSFFYDHLLTDDAVARMRSLSSESHNISPEVLLHYVGICLDTCHTSVMYETPTNMAKLLTEKGIGIFKIQLTAALSVKEIDHEGMAILQQLSDPVYLHQTSISDKKGNRKFYLDLPEALKQVVIGENLCVHYHVPVFRNKINKLDTTQKELVKFLDYFIEDPLCQHLEIETYTFDVLPDKYKHSSVVDNICQELHWVLETLNK